MSTRTPPRFAPPLHPALIKQRDARGKSIQLRIADRITSFAGSMTFAYLHVVWFAIWIGAAVEDYPFGLLTMIVSLEAIFLSTFVLVSQNRADERRQALADHEWELVQIEEKQNEELIDVSRQILALTRAVHELVAKGTPDAQGIPE